ncbi:MAG: MBL fold metallo-hydrolase [Pirellulales bacterium]|nr:MBL fold metallo-hydrolase [Pirellulales bacterium]
MNLGNWQLETVSGGEFRLDGGAMFGIVPKPLWERIIPADDRNRITLQTNCVLARDGNHTLLIDTGYGGKESERFIEIHGMEQGAPLLDNLYTAGVSPEGIDFVVFSHLHFDHAGGGVVRDDCNALVPAFPNAKYVAQRLEWEVANSGSPELAGNYPPENLRPLEEAGQLRLIEDGEEIVPGLRGLVTGGHTAGHHALTFESGGDKAIYLGDLCPTHAHLRRMWCMAYDMYPLETRRKKPELLAQIADNGWTVLFDHDPVMAGCCIEQDHKREFAISDRLNVL